MTKKKVGSVTPQERDQIKQLFERKNGLNELAKILTADNEALYEKLIDDMGSTSANFQKWWTQMSSKYNWEASENGHWEINFDTCEIYLVD